MHLLSSVLSFWSILWRLLIESQLFSVEVFTMYFFLSFYHQPVWSFLLITGNQVLLCIQFYNFCLLIGLLSLFIFNIKIYVWAQFYCISYLFSIYPIYFLFLCISVLSSIFECLVFSIFKFLNLPHWLVIAHIFQWLL